MKFFVSNTYFKHRIVHKYARLVRGREGVEIKSMIDLVLGKMDMLRYVQDMRAVRGMGRSLSDRYVVLCKVRLVGASGVNENGRNLIEMCTEKRLSLGNAFFEKKDIHKFTWVSG